MPCNRIKILNRADQAWAVHAQTPETGAQLPCKSEIWAQKIQRQQGNRRLHFFLALKLLLFFVNFALMFRNTKLSLSRVARAPNSGWASSCKSVRGKTRRGAANNDRKTGNWKLCKCNWIERINSQATHYFFQHRFLGANGGATFVCMRRRGEQ